MQLESFGDETRHEQALPFRFVSGWIRHVRRDLGAIFAVVILLGASVRMADAAPEPASVVPVQAPRTLVLAGKADAFRAYCTTGEGAKAFARIRADLDRTYLTAPFPAEPVTYGDPSPSKRTSDMADTWRAQQDTTGRISAIAEAATLCWIVTGEEKYFAKAREILLGESAWHFEPDWKAGAVPGATDIYYNDEAHFRLWRKLPLVYDQLRAKLSPDDRRTILAHFKTRGDRSVAWIRRAKVQDIRRNSLDIDAESHPVRFMAMTALTALALWDDLPEARDWWAFAYTFYRDQFSPWGGDDGGWAEGNAYWRGTFEHASFQDTLLSLGDPLAYSSAFWQNSPYFCLYNVQPYLHTIFGDASNAGHFNLEPATADYFDHMARVTQNGFFRAYAELCTDQRPRPIDKGLANLDRTYPTAAEFLIRNFIASGKPLPAARPLSQLPPDRYFADIGWVALHSALGDPANDIQVTFKSSPYGSFSHSHADQNAFIVNAFGESLAINSAYREYHNSPHHDQWTRQTKSKNAVLIDGVGEKPRDKSANGHITRFEQKPRYDWVTGDATAAYARAQQNSARVQRVTRDLVFIDRRYLIIRDHVVLATPGKVSWLLHGEQHIDWNPADATATIRGEVAALSAKLLARGTTWSGAVTNKFPVPVDPKYVQGEAGAGYVTGTWHDQAHFTAETVEPAKEFVIYAVLWPKRTAGFFSAIADLGPDGVLTVKRPDGKIDSVELSDDALTLTAK
jgi:hypothetical protein